MSTWRRSSCSRLKHAGSPCSCSCSCVCCCHGQLMLVYNVHDVAEISSGVPTAITTQTEIECMSSLLSLRQKSPNGSSLSAPHPSLPPPPQCGIQIALPNRRPSRTHPSTLTHEDLRPHPHIPLANVARHLGTCTTQLKNAIASWGSRAGPPVK